MPAIFHESSPLVNHICTAPNLALCVAEVFGLILDELGDDKRSISHLAFTCKAMAEPALDRLWAHNDSLEPFIPLLPEELVLDDSSFFRFDHEAILNLPSEKWAKFDNYARRARRLYAKTVTMHPHRVYSSIYKQLTAFRPNVELFPNLIVLAFHARHAPNPDLRMFPSSLRHVTFSWVNVKAPETEAILWSSTLNRLLIDAPHVEHIYFEGSPGESLCTLTPIPFRQLRKVTIKASPLGPSVLHKYSHVLSASVIQELDLRFVHWPDPGFHPIAPTFPWLKKLTFDGSPNHAVEFVRLLSSPALKELVITSQSERSGNALNLYVELLFLLANKYRGVFKTLKIQYPLLCHQQTSLQSFLSAARALADSGVDTLQVNLIVTWQGLSREVQSIIDPSNWKALKCFRISSRRAGASWSWTAHGYTLFGL